MKEVNVLISKSVEQQRTSIRANQRQNDNIDREVVCKILEGDPEGAASRIQIKIGNEKGSRNKRILEDSASAEQLLPVNLKKPRLISFYSSTPCSREKHSSADSDCFLGSLNSLNETTADFFHNHQVFLKSKQDIPELDLDLDDSLLDPSDNEKEDSPFRMTEDEISSLLDDNLVAGDVEKHAIEISSPKYSYWHERNQRTETSGSRLSPVKNNISESDSENPGEWATSMIILSEWGATPSRTEASEPKHEYKREPKAEVNLKSRNVINIPFDLDIDELLALSPIDGSTVDHGDELALGEEDHYLSKDCKSPVGIDDLLDDVIVSKPRGKTNSEEVLFKADENNSKRNISNQAVAAIKPREKQQVHLSVLVEQPHSCGQIVQSEKPEKTEENNIVSSTNLTKNIRPVALVPSCIPASHVSSGKDSSSAQKLTAFLLQLNKPVNVSGPLPASGGSSSSSGALDSKNVESKNTDVAESPLMTQSNTAVEKGKNHASTKDSTKVLPPVKKLGKVAPLPKKETRHEPVPHAELEWKKQTYLQCVLKHMRSTQQPNQDAYDELLLLMDQVASAEYKNQEQNWQHPSDLTTRNYPRFAKKVPNKYSLKQWVSQNGGYYRRFQNLADHFQRSPVVTYSSI
ncbi:S100P-binding protein [Lissotriton helveticus]